MKIRLPDPYRSFAVLIGTSSYDRGSGLADLPSVDNNLRALAALLTDPALGGLPPERCAVILDPCDVRRLNSTLRDYARSAEDTFLLYFAGHGRTDQRNDLYLTLTDTDTDDLPLTALAYERVREILRDITPADNRVLILDCCFSGRAIADLSGPDGGRFAISGSYVLTATSATESALAPDDANYTVFTGHLLDIVYRGIPDSREFLTYPAIFPRLDSVLAANGGPRPRQQNIDNIENLAISRNPGNPNNPRPAPFHASTSPSSTPSFHIGRPAPLRSQSTQLPRGAASSDFSRPQPSRLPQPAAVPQQLPPSPRWFTDRVDKVAALTDCLSRAADTSNLLVVSAIAGAGGIGKTSLALHWAHQQIGRFPDGQLFVDLRGFAPTGQPMLPGEAIRGFLDALGIDSQSIPVDLDAQIARYRSLVAGKRMLIVLDNARDATQVAPLLPGSPTCTVLVTSRNRMDGLAVTHGITPLAIGVLNESDAHELLAERLGQPRVAAEPEAVAELVRYCAGLPLALSIVAGRAAFQPDFPITVLADELRDVATRLAVLEAGDPRATVEAVMSWSYAALSDRQARIFRLLGIAPGPDISLLAVASLTNLPAHQAAAELLALVRVSLVDQYIPSRYRMHDLTRLYAAQQAQDSALAHEERDSAWRRVIDFYLHTAYWAALLIDPFRKEIALGQPAFGCHPRSLPDEAAAWAWFEAEYPALLASQQVAVSQRWDTKTWQLALVLHTFHQRRGHLYNQLSVWDVGLAAAKREGDLVTLSRAHSYLGTAYARIGRPAEALEHLNEALDLSCRAGDLSDQADAHRWLADAWELQLDDQRALEHATKALEIFQILEQPAWEAVMLGVVGWYSARLGDYTQARATCETALTLSRRHHSAWGTAKALGSLSYVAYRTGRYDEALDHYQQVRVMYRDLGDRYNEAETLDYLGQAQAALGHRAEARDSWQQAFELFNAQGREVDADRIQRQLESLS